MRLRSQFVALVGLALLVGGGALTALVWSVRETQDLWRKQQQAVTIAGEMTGLLILTQDYLLHREPRARQQWQARFHRLGGAVASAKVIGLGEGEQTALGETIQILPELFDELERLPDPALDTLLEAKRRELLVGRLLAEVQAVAERAYERESEFTQRRNDSERRLMMLSVALPAVLVLLFALATWLLARRLLRPLARLHASMEAVASGNLSVRAASAARDELGELGRQFDRMTVQLRERSDALRSSEALLRLVTDNLPAMIGYWDRSRRNRFANADYRRWFGKTPEEIYGRTIDELLGTELYEKNKPFIDAALAGRRQDFDRAIPGPDGVMRYSQASYIPDTHTGSVEGFFVLVTDVTDRVHSEQALEKALNERETLLKEVYHRVKNNLQVVQSLLNLQSRALQDGTARDALKEMAQRVRAMALVHEQLYRSTSLTAVPLRTYVEDLARQLAYSSARGPGEVRLEVDVAPVDIGTDAAIPLGLLLTELVSNSFKHAFPDGRTGRITIRIGPEAEGVRICVSDDGVGMPSGLDPVAARSIGLQLAASLARQLGGELQFQTGRGTTVCLVVPHL